MNQGSNRSVLAMMMVLAFMFGLDIVMDHYNARIASAGGGGHQGNDGWIAFSGQKADGPETVYVFKTKTGQPRTRGKYTFNDNGPRLAVYRVNSSGKLKLTSMRNVGPDVDEYIDALYPDNTGPSVHDVKDENYKARTAGPAEEETEEEEEEGMPIDD